MSEPIITQADYEAAERLEALGPHYFTAQTIARRFMATFEAEHFKPLIDKFSSELTERLQTDLDDYLLNNSEMNIQGSMWRMVDEVVEALLGGKRWALARWPLSAKYDAPVLRAAIAQHIPKELQDARIADLEKEVERLRSDLDWARR